MTRTSIFNKLRQYRLGFKAAVSTAYMYMYCRLYGVQIGKGCRFWNRSVIIMQNGAMIRIGDRCILRSDFDSNLIGVGHPCIISAHAADTEVIIGDDCAFSGVSIGALQSIRIGRNVQVGANTLITDSDWHSLDPADRDNQDKIGRNPVVIGDNVWIGSSCIILKGVTIGENSVIGSGSVVTGDIPANAVCGGNPCKVIRMDQ